MKASLKEIISDSSTQSEIARACKITQQAVSDWLRKGRVPAKRVMKVSAITGVAPAVLNPDVFGDTTNQYQSEES